MIYAIDVVLGSETLIAVARADDADDAYYRIRNGLRERGFVSASMQGSPRSATQNDCDRAQWEFS